jgi:biopolymer transport protein ExbD
VVQKQTSGNRAIVCLVSVLLLLCIAAVNAISQDRKLLISVATAERSHNGVDPCGDVRHIILTIHKDGTAKLNVDPSMEMGALAPRLREIFRTRAYKIVYVWADPGVSFEQFVRLVETIRPEVELVSILSPEVVAQIRPRVGRNGELLDSPSYCLGPGLPIDWANSPPIRLK